MMPVREWTAASWGTDAYGMTTIMHCIARITLAALALSTGCYEPQGVEIGPRGGVVASEDGRFSLAIARLALEQDVEITIDEIECDAPKVVGPCYELGPVGLPLLRPGSVRYELYEEVRDDIEDLELLTERDDVWSPLADHDVDLERDAVVASALYLSTYAAVLDESRD
jgi:hypothetical protein